MDPSLGAQLENIFLGVHGGARRSIRAPPSSHHRNRDDDGHQHPPTHDAAHLEIEYDERWIHNRGVSEVLASDALLHQEW